MAKWLIPVKETNMSEETKEIKKMKMEAMRMLVRDHLTGKNSGNVKHLGELQLDSEENTRLVISLQDFADRVLGKLKRATGHMASASETIDYLDHTARQQQQTIEVMGYRQEALVRQNKDLNETNRIQGEKLESAERQLAVFKELFVEHEQSHKNEKVPVPVEFGEKASAAGLNPDYKGLHLKPHSWSLFK
jgi:hypothetical protein